MANTCINADCMPKPSESKGDRKVNNRIFVNRTLNLNKIKFYGFDMDYTLAEYTQEFESITFDLIKERLLEVGYPREILEFEYDPSFPIRGLWYDMLYGNLLKVDLNGNILVCVHGFEFYKYSQIMNLYPNMFLQYDESRIYIFYTLFNLPETYLIACLIDYFTHASLYLREKTGVRYGNLYMSFESIFQDVRGAVDHVHRTNLNAKTIQNMNVCLKKYEDLPLLLARIRDSGAKLFLLTNSDYKYTNQIMTYLFDFKFGPKHSEHRKNWKTYFDCIVVDAKKPLFFGEGTTLRQVDITTGALKMGNHVGPLSVGNVYSGGSCNVFTSLIGANGTEVLYIGDHIFGDILKSKKIGGWRTFLVIPELIQELHVWTDKCQLFTELQTLGSQLIDKYKHLDSSTKEIPDISKFQTAIREVTHKMDLSYGLLGSLFRSGSRQTYFSAQVVRYADIYSSSCTNLIYYPFCYMFRAPPMLMPHESTVAHEQKFSLPSEKSRTENRSVIFKNNLQDVGTSSHVKSIPHHRPETPRQVTHTIDEDFSDDEDKRLRQTK